MSRIQTTLSVTVAVLTRKRPKMLQAVLASFGNLARPENCTVRFLVVENDDVSGSSEIIERANDAGTIGPIDHVLETNLGIPFARNRAAKHAISNGSDLLAFVDDDEVVDRNWLERLIHGYRESGAKLLGAPLRIAHANSDLSLFQSHMHGCIARRYERKERRAARRGSFQGTPGVTIVTNNWLAELTLFTDHGIWFDEKMQFTGGTDAKFYAEVQAQGIPTAWVKDAYVYETVPAERLSFWYQYRRGRDQSNTNFKRKISNNANAKYSVAMSLAPKMIAVVLLALLLPITIGRTLHDLSRTMGWISGRVGALLGHRSELYTQTTGY